MKRRYLAALGAAATASMLLAAPAHASFMPSISEFWIMKDGNEIFRDSFSDGLVPASGPDGAATYSSSPQAGLGGMTGESGGLLTMTPSLGAPTLITGVFANTFTGGLRLASTNPASPAFLGQPNALEVHGLFDLSILPAVTGQSYGIRLTDRAGDGTGDDVAQLLVSKSSVTGNIGVRFAELDFVGDTDHRVDFASIQGSLATGAWIELILTKAAGDVDVDASFVVYDSAFSVVQSGVLDAINDVTGNPVTLFNGESFTRAQFFATDLVEVPEPGALALLGLGLAGLGFGRRRARG